MPDILCGLNLRTFRGAALPGVGGTVTYLEYDREALAARLPAVDILCPSLRVRVTRELLEHAPRLRCIATPSTGTDHLDLVAARELGITVFSLKDDIEFLRSVTATAELAFALLLATVRNLPFAFEAVRAGSWDNTPFRGTSSTRRRWASSATDAWAR